MQNAATVGAYLRDQLRELATTHSDHHITNVRGAGLFCAFDLPSKEERNAFLTRAYENQLLLVGSGDRSIRFRPPLNLSKEEVDIGMGLIEKSIAG